MSTDRAAMLRARLGKPPSEASGNLGPVNRVPEQVNDAPEPAKPIVEPVQPPKEEGRAMRRSMRPGDLAAPERKSVADFVDGRVLRATGRVRPLNLALSDQTQDEFRSEAVRRKDERLGKHQFNDLFELAWQAYKEKHGLS